MMVVLLVDIWVLWLDYVLVEGFECNQ